ncbi:shikimate dehydrogenase [Kocuria sp. HSID16901]|uniref:shikimate dehydrogenase n=1 Tax=Kocuria sp. HSID16901 TaxID=2419505 RepID=UPI00066045E5|nr:shikimate dehydrogenase [Kocuria sp. HSID16901]MCT1367692.1 shikimate dehydrogenase [Rothia sp. p3-SID1597]RUQ20251.1 shikimate dehydrogenase [Kocuria sp. HSID16901]
MSLVGESYVVGLIGSGITATLSAPMHEKAADTLGLRYIYRPIDLDTIPDGVERAPELLKTAVDVGFSAFNITFPCKQTIIEYLDEVAPDAARLGAVNTVVVDDGRLIGHNTDFSGFASALDAGLPGADLTSVVQLGTGGAGSATAYAVLSRGAVKLSLFDVDPQRSAERATELSGQFPDASVVALTADDLPQALAEASGLINATPIGMHHHPGAPLDLDLLHPELWVADVIYLPQETALIKRGRQLGCRVLPGGYMAVGQAVDAFELITGSRPDYAELRTYFERLVADQQGETP